MYEYKIVKTDLGWSIYRKKQIWKLMILQYLYSNGNRWPNNWLARIFYHKESALAALVVVRHNEWEESDKADDNNVSDNN
jgi:hypothetical protein